MVLAITLFELRKHKWKTYASSLAYDKFSA